MVADLQVRAQVVELIPLELLAVVRDHYLRYSEATHDIFPEEVRHFLLGDSG